MKHLFFLSFSLFLFGCQYARQDLGWYHTELSDTGGISPLSIEISNPNKHSALFIFNINGRFPASASVVETEVRKIATLDSVPLELAAYKYVCERTYHSEPLSRDNWQHEPMTFLSSLGGGYCDDRASILAATWNLLGFKARVIGLSGHLVAEVFAAEAWHMFDADMQVYFQNENKEVLSVNEISRTQSAKELFAQSLHTGFSEILFCESLAQNRYWDCFATTEDNEDVTDWHVKPFDIDTFSLTGGGKLKLSVDKDGFMHSASVTLASQNDLGLTKLPFLVYPQGVGSSLGRSLQTKAPRSASHQTILEGYRSSGTQSPIEIELFVNNFFQVLDSTGLSIQVQSNKELNVSVEQVADVGHATSHEPLRLFITKELMHHYHLLSCIPRFNSLAETVDSVDTYFRRLSTANPLFKDCNCSVKAEYEELRNEYGFALDKLTKEYHPMIWCVLFFLCCEDDHDQQVLIRNWIHQTKSN